MATTKVTTDVTDLSGDTGGLVWAKGTEAQRPGSPNAGDLRENTDSDRVEVYNGSEWRNLKEEDVSTEIDFLVVAGGGGTGTCRCRDSWALRTRHARCWRGCTASPTQLQQSEQPTSYEYDV